MKNLKKPFVFCILYSTFLILLSAAILLDAFVIPNEISNDDGGFTTAEVTFSFGQVTGAPKEDTRKADSTTDGKPTEDTDKVTDVANDPSETDIVSEDDITSASPVTNEETQYIPETEAVITPICTDNEYRDENIWITLETVRIHDTQVYVADIRLSSAEYFKTALAQNKFGTNISEKTSTIAKENGAFLAINGDYYGANKKGYVIKNGVLYRDTVRSDYEYDDLCFMYDGSFQICNEKDVSAETLLNSGVYQLFGFGPVLVSNSVVTVDSGDEVGQAMASNPRTAIGIIDELHYVFIVSDGRTKESEGLSLVELATFMREYGCTTAYNLDGGGSSTMYFNGKVVNNPVNRGNKISERSVSDIVYIGY